MFSINLVKNQFKRSKLLKAVLAMLILILIVNIHIKPSFADIGAQTEVQMGETIKVGLKYGSNAISQCKLACDGGFCVVNYSKNGNMPIVQRISSTSINVISANGTINITDYATGEVLLNGVVSENVVLPLFYNEGYILSVNGSNYRGGLSFQLKTDGSFELINVVNIDQYVYGVLPSEIGYNSPVEAIKAQAVAARSYALVAARKGGNHNSSGFDVCATTHCQVYKGADSEKNQTNQAAKDTAGQCIYYDGEPVMAYYAKNSGGYTQNVSDVWGSDLGYLKAVPDPYCAEYKWEKTYSFSEIENILEKAGKGVGTISSIEITARNQNYNVKEITFTGSTGTQVMKCANFRSMLGATAIKSSMFGFNGQVTTVNVDRYGNLAGSGSTSAPDISGNPLKKLYVRMKDGISQIIGSSAIYVVDSQENTRQLNQQSCYITGSDGQVHKVDISEKVIKDNTSAVNEKSVGVNADGTYTIKRVVGDEKVTDGTLKIIGLGYGHGIGLQQDGAIAMGKLGFSYEEILHYYYTDVEIK